MTILLSIEGYNCIPGRTEVSIDQFRYLKLGKRHMVLQLYELRYLLYKSLDPFVILSTLFVESCQVIQSENFLFILVHMLLTIFIISGDFTSFLNPVLECIDLFIIFSLPELFQRKPIQSKTVGGVVHASVINVLVDADGDDAGYVAIDVILLTPD